MMGLVRLALRRPYTAAIASLLILLMGALATTRMIVDIFPIIDIPVVLVAWNYPGLSAEDMERRVVLVSERSYSQTINGISHIESQAIPSTGIIKIYFEPGTDIGGAIAQISAANNTILRIVPPGMTPPNIIQFNAASVPVIQLTATSKSVPEQKIFDYALNFLRLKLFTIPGLSVTAPYGGKSRQIVVSLDPPRMAAKGVAPNDVVQALQASNVIVPAGVARIGTREYNVALNSSPPNVEQFNQLPLGIRNGVPVTLGDVAHVADSFATQTQITHVNGERAIFLLILRHSDASTLAVINATRDLMPEIQAAAPEGIELHLDFDQSVFVRAAINNVVREAIVSSILVSLMILLFLGSWRNTIIVALSIPLSIFAAIAGLLLTGQSINLMTLGGLSLAIGLLVDNATVTIENIHRNQSLGKPLVVAILDGTSEVVQPLTVATLAICIVFFPVVLVDWTGAVPLHSARHHRRIGDARLLCPLLFGGAELRPLHARRHRASTWACRRRASSWDTARRARRVRAQRRRLPAGLRALSSRLWPLARRGSRASRLHSPCRPRPVRPDRLARHDGGHGFLSHGRCRHHQAALSRAGRHAARGDRATDPAGRQQDPRPYSRRRGRHDQRRHRRALLLQPRDRALRQCQQRRCRDHDPAQRRSSSEPRLHSQDPGRSCRRRFPAAQFYFQNGDIVSQVLNFGLPAPIDMQVQAQNFDQAQALARQVLQAMQKIPGIADPHIVQILNYPSLNVNVDRLKAAELGLSQRDVSNNMLIALSTSQLVAPSQFLNPVNNVNYAVVVAVPLDKMQSVDDLMSTSIAQPVNTPLPTTQSTLAVMPNAPVTQLAGRCHRRAGHEL